MAQSGSACVTAVKAFADSRYQKECKIATAWSKAFCTAGLQETGKLTFPIRSDGSIPCCDHVVGTASARTATIATSPTVVFMLSASLGHVRAWILVTTTAKGKATRGRTRAR